MNIKKNIWNHHLEHAMLEIFGFKVKNPPVKDMWNLPGHKHHILGNIFPPQGVSPFQGWSKRRFQCLTRPLERNRWNMSGRVSLKIFLVILKYWKKTTWLLKWMPHYDACIIRCFFHPGGNFKRKFTTLLSWPEETHVSKLSRLVFFNLAASFLAARLTSSLATHSYL